MGIGEVFRDELEDVRHAQLHPPVLGRRFDVRNRAMSTENP